MTDVSMSAGTRMRHFLLAASLCVGALLALPAQTTENLPLHISADRAQMDDRSGIGVYTGNVVVTRGDMTLWADRITVHTEARRPVRIEAEGRPARAESPDLANRPRVATSRRMEYTFSNQVLVLIEDARVETFTEDARGDRITYDLVNETVGIEGKDSRRVQITIQPREE